MIINENSKVINIDLSNNEDIKLPNVFTGLKKNITRIDNKLYYCKKVSQDLLLNELIGSYLSKQIGLDSVDYKIGKYNDNYYAISELFFKDEYEYYYPYQKGYDLIYDYENLDHYDEIVYFENNIPKNNKSITNKILELIILDIKMGQSDRHNSSNLLLKRKNDDIDYDLCPIYDFGNSYSDLPCYPNYNVYSNSFVIVKKNIESLNMLLKDYPQVYEIIDVLNNISMESLFDDIEKKNSIEISKYKRMEYENLNEEYSKVLKMI